MESITPPMATTNQLRLENLQKLLADEQKGPNREKVVGYLKREIVIAEDYVVTGKIRKLNYN